MDSFFELLYTFNALFDKNYPENYTEKIFPIVGILSIGLVFFCLVIYYVIINRVTTRFSHTKHWLIVLTFLSILGFIIAIVRGSNVNDGNWDGYLVTFGIINAVYSSIFFFLFSLVFKGFSSHAKKVPF